MVNRYRDLLSILPKGKTYAADGDVLPFRDAPYEFEFRTDKPDREFRVYFNEIQSNNTVTTDAQGIAIVKSSLGLRSGEASLPPGEYTIRIVDVIEQTSSQMFITIKHLATWLAAYADVLEQMDIEIDDMYLARSIETVGSKYIGDVYGRTLRQPAPTTMLHEEYRNLLMQLRPAYRHFGAHPYGMRQAVEAFTSATPFEIPRAWRPRWTLGAQLLDNHDFQTRTRLHSSMFASAGDTTRDLPDINRQSRVYVYGSFSTTLVSSGFRQPPHPQKLTVTFGSSGARATLFGVDEHGYAFSEIIPDPAVASPLAQTYTSRKIFETITSAQVTTGAGTASIGVSDTRFVRVVDINDYNGVEATPGTTRIFYYGVDSGKPVLRLGGGPQVPITIDLDSNGDPVPTQATLLGPARTAYVHGLVQASSLVAPLSLNPLGGPSTVRRDRIWIDVDNRGVLQVDLGSSASASFSDVITAINSAFTFDPRYGAAYSANATSVLGTEGVAQYVLQVRSTETGPAGSVAILTGPCDAGRTFFGVPKTTTELVSAVTTPFLTLTCVDASRMPEVSSSDADASRQFDVRIQGLRLPQTSGFTMTSPNAPSLADSTNAVVFISPFTYAFSASHVGGYLRWVHTSLPAPSPSTANNGLHRIIAYNSSANTITLEHELSSSGGQFKFPASPMTGDAVVYHPGETRTITNRAGNVLTLDSAVSAWPIGAFVELPDEVPHKIVATRGLEEVSIEVDTTVRPRHDFGDSIVNHAGATWKVVSSRADFTGLTGSSITIADAQNAQNNGTFTITSSTATEARFTNASALAETSSFSWEITTYPFASALEDDFDVVGSRVPDGWYADNGASASGITATAENVAFGALLGAATGKYVPSPIMLESTSAIIRLWRACPQAMAYRGLPLDIDVRLSEHTEAAADFKLDVSFDGSTYHDVVNVTTSVGATPLYQSGVLTRGPTDPFTLSGTFFVPYDASTCVVRLTRTGTASPGTITLERFAVWSQTGSSLSTARNTVVRNAKRSQFGEWLYVWSAEPLTEEEKGYLGLPLTTNPADSTYLSVRPGHIDYTANSHGYWNRANVSELDDSGVDLIRKNVRGVYDSIDWLDVDAATQLVNLEVVVATPSRLTHVVPTRTGSNTGEELAMIEGFDGPGTARADLSEASNHEGAFPMAPNPSSGGNFGTGARLYEIRLTDTSQVNADGLVTIIPAGQPIPLPDTLDVAGVQPWEFTSATQVRVNSPYFNATSSYSIDYDVMMRATSLPFQLTTTLSTGSDYLWLTDLARYLRHSATANTFTQTEQASFLANFTASLTMRADTNAEASLERDDGTTIRTIDTGLWEFTDSQTIRIDSSVFDPDSIYTITYVARVVEVETPVTLRLEWRHAASSGALSSAAWEAIQPGQVVSPVFNGGSDVTQNEVHEWNQLRVTIIGVTDTRDVRLFGMGLKGIHLFGTTPVAPGILTPDSLDAAEP